MLKFLAKTAILSAIPKLVDEISLLLFGSDTPPVPVAKQIQRKHVDSTKLTQGMYDFIVSAHEEFIAYNFSHPHNKKTQFELTDVINEHLELNKSLSVYSRVWRGLIDRNDLPVGKKYFN